MDIQVVSNREDENLELGFFRDIAEYALRQRTAPEECEVSIALVEIAEMGELNHQYRSIEGPTDVLSFPCDDPWEGVGPSGVIVLGDIIIAPDIAAQQAEQLGHTVGEELELLTVHGVLHLLGYDHIDDSEAEVMQGHERDILSAWRSERRGA